MAIIKMAVHVKRENMNATGIALADHYAKLAALIKLMILSQSSKDKYLQGFKEII